MEQNFVSLQKQFATRRRFAAKSPLTLFVKNPDACEPLVGTVLPQTSPGANGERTMKMLLLTTVGWYREKALAAQPIRPPVPVL